MTVTVNRYFTLGPRTFCLAVRDGDIDHPDPAIREVTPEPEMDWNDSYPIDGYDGKLCGINKDHVALRDKITGQEWLVREDANNQWDPTDVSMYDTLTFGTATCTGVTRRTNRMLDEGINDSNQWVQWEHWLCYHLDTDLADIDGQSIVIENTEDAFPDFSTTLDLENTPCEAIHSTTHGIAPGAPRRMQLSAWMPGWGTEGVVDFSDFSYAYIQRADTGAIVSDRFPITLRQDTAIDDSATRTPGDGAYEVLSTTHYFPITAITKADPMVITATDHDFEVDDVTAVQYATGMNDANFFGSERLTITAVDGNDITIGAVDSSAYDDYTGEGYLYEVIDNNHSGTNVYEAEAPGFDPLDLSLEYRWYIPGLGHSPETFTFDYANYLEAAKRYFWCWADSFLNGKEKVGPYYQAPQNFSESSHGTWNFTYATYYNHTENSGPVTTAAALTEAWTSASPPSLPNIPRFNLQDAGDYDVRFQSNWLYGIIVGYDYLSPTARGVSFGYGTALSHGVDATYWAGTEGLPDFIQGMIVCFEGQRLLRWPDGEVSGGYNHVGNSMSAEAPSYLSSFDNAVFAPDVISTYQYAGIAAAMGRIMNAEGLTALGATLIAEAEESYAKAEAIVATPLDFWVYDWMNTNQNTEYTNRLSTLTSTGHRAKAALYLYAATDDTDYLTTAENGLDPDGNDRRGRYASFTHWALGEDENKGEDYENSFTSFGDSGITLSDACAWPTASLGGSSEFRNWSPHTGEDRFLHAWLVSGDVSYLELIAQIADHLLGCNPQNSSWTRGIGSRTMRGQLNVDTQYRKEDPPAGTTPFGYNRWSQSTNMSSFTHGFGNSGLSFVSFFTYRNQTSGVNVYKQPEPCQWSIPFWDFRLEHRRLVSLMEHTPEDPLRLFLLFMVLWDAYGKGVTTAGSRKRFVAAA